MARRRRTYRSALNRSARKQLFFSSLEGGFFFFFSFFCYFSFHNPAIQRKIRFTILRPIAARPFAAGRLMRANKRSTNRVRARFAHLMTAVAVIAQKGQLMPLSDVLAAHDFQLCQFTDKAPHPIDRPLPALSQHGPRHEHLAAAHGNLLPARTVLHGAHAVTHQPDQVKKGFRPAEHTRLAPKRTFEKGTRNLDKTTN